MMDELYHRIERQPMGRLISAVQQAGLRTHPVGRNDVHAEVVRDGMLVGWLRKVEGVNVLELSKREMDPETLGAISGYVARCETEARRAMMSGASMMR